MVENLPANAGDMGSIPGLGRSPVLWDNIARVPQLPSLRSRAGGLQLLRFAGSRAYALQEKRPPREARTLQLEGNPCSPQLENARAAMKTQCSQKQYIYIFN